MATDYTTDELVDGLKIQKQKKIQIYWQTKAPSVSNDEKKDVIRVQAKLKIPSMQARRIKKQRQTTSHSVVKHM